MKAVKVCTNGTVEGVDLQEPVYQAITDLIGGMEIIRMPEWPMGIVMVVDDCGKLKKLPHNIVGSYLYGDEIVGDIVMICEGMTEEGPGFVDMGQDFYDETIEVMNDIYQGVSSKRELGHEARAKDEEHHEKTHKGMDPDDLEQLLEMTGAQVIRLGSMEDLPDVLWTIMEGSDEHVSDKGTGKGKNTGARRSKSPLN